MKSKTILKFKNETAYNIMFGKVGRKLRRLGKRYPKVKFDFDFDIDKKEIYLTASGQKEDMTDFQDMTSNEKIILNGVTYLMETKIEIKDE